MAARWSCRVMVMPERLVGGTADDIAAAVAGVTANGAGDAVVNYAGAEMTLVGIAPNAVTEELLRPCLRPELSPACSWL